MAKISLSSAEAAKLLANYRSQENQLQYQLSVVEKEIAGLEKKMGQAQRREEREAARAAKAASKARAKSTKTTKSSGRRGRPKKTTTATNSTAANNNSNEAVASSKVSAKKPATKKATSRKRSSTKETGYRLNETDQMIMDALNEKGSSLIASDLVSYIMDKESNAGKSPKEGEVKSRINRALHKLANRRSDLKKVKYSGRGYAYALPEWVNPKGEAKRQYKYKG